MYKFPENLYTDVRIEEVFETKIVYTMGILDESRIRKNKAAFIRIFDGKRWYHSSTTECSNIQKEIDILSSFANPDDNIYNNPVVKKFEINKGNYLSFQENDLSMVSLERKQELLKSFFPITSSRPMIKLWKTIYVDKRVVKSFCSSKGTDLIFDVQTAGAVISFSLVEGDKKLDERFQKADTCFEKLETAVEELKPYIEKCEDYIINSKPVKKGRYTVILSPMSAGVFAHESFGHKSEADFMVGDETMKKEWTIGKKVGTDILSIVDDGTKSGSGYVPFDDEGTKARETFLVKNGILNGRLHSASTASDLDEDVTGNARAVNFEYEPIVRMTTTYISSGSMTKDELIADVDEGIFVDTIKHGSGMSTFTLAPNRCYMIRHGRISEPVNISVITGNVMETLNAIDGVSDKLELLSFVTGGCGKNEQFPLPVGFGGPYVRVRNMNVQ